MNAQLNVLLFNFTEGALLPIELQEHFNAHESIAFHQLNTPLEASVCLQQNEHTVFIFISKDNQDLSQIKLLLKRFKKKVAENKIRPVAILGDYNQDNFSVLKKLACHDIFNFKVSAENLIEIIEDTEDTLLLNDPELSAVEGFEDEVATFNHQSSDEIDAENSYLINGFLDETAAPKQTVSSVTDVSENEDLHQKAMEHPNLGGISLESGKMELQISEVLPEDTQLVLEHFSADELEFEVKSSEVVDLKEGDKIDMQVVFVYDRCRVEVMVDGTITGIQQENEASSIVSLNLSQDESLKLEQFMALFQKRQTQIQEFMEVAQKGILYSPSSKGIA